MKIVLIFAIFSFLFGSSFAVIAPPRYFGGCQLLGTKSLYCYGGKGSSDSNATSFNDINMLDLSTDYSSLDSLTKGWKSIVNSMNFPNSDFLMVPVNSSTFMVIGGPAYIKVPNTLYAFNALTGLWSNMTEPYLGTAIPPLRGSALTYFGGGYSMFTSYIVGGATYGDSTTLFTNVVQVDLPFVYTRLLSPNSNLAPTINYRIGHSATYYFSKVSVFGGQQIVNNQWQSVPMNQVSQFDTIYSTWTTASFTGSIPTSRSYFTMTQISNTEYLNQYIIFGGINADTNQVATDVMYKVSITDGTYQSITANNGPSPRFGHSAVFYGSQSILILNGMDSTGAVLSDINVFHTGAQQWMNQFSSSETYPGISNNGNNNNGNGNVTVIYSGGDYDSSDSALAGGLGAGFFVFISLVGFALHKYVEKHVSLHQESDSYDNKESNQYNNIIHQSSSPSTNQYHDNNNYQSSPLPPSSPVIDNRPLPPAPIMSMPSGPQYNNSSSAIFYQQDVPYPHRQ